jgi:DNA-binding FadR family transcriptional regulator
LNAVTGVSTVRVPKAGEMVAAHLRRQIVLGELKEGDQLPSESVLMEDSASRGPRCGRRSASWKPREPSPCGGACGADSHDWQHEQELAKIALRAHTRLVKLIRKRSGEEAEELWRKHLAESAKVVLGDRTTATVVELLS